MLQRTPSQPHQNLDTLLERLRSTAVERDRAGGHPAAEKALLRDHGLLVLSVPQEFGGTGADWPDILATVRRIATVDSSLAHLLAFQHLQLSGVLAYGSAEQQARQHRQPSRPAPACHRVRCWPAAQRRQRFLLRHTRLPAPADHRHP